MIVRLHPGAALDLGDAFRFYRREAGLAVARRFATEFARVTRLLSEFPDLGTPTDAGRRVYPLTGFPYSLIYKTTPARLHVLVVRHQSRDPSHGGQRG